MSPNGEVDSEALSKLIEYHIDSGTSALGIAGTTGESATLTMKEHADVIRFAVECAADRIPVIAGTGSNSTHEAIELTVAAAEAGARVTLIAGPVALDTPNRVKRIDVVRAEDMHEASLKAVEEGCDIFIATAAVADYRPTVTADHKIKKSTEEIHLTLVKNPDIIAAVASHAKRPFTVGFAAETQDVIEYAQGKLKSKKLDMIATNDVSGTNVGFNSDNNALTVIWPGGHKVLPLASKAQIAKQLIELIAIRQS